MVLTCYPPGPYERTKLVSINPRGITMSEGLRGTFVQNPNKIREKLNILQKIIENATLAIYLFLSFFNNNNNRTILVNK